ncbi:tyrosine-type recombinase/integrase [Muricoccus nepalensis]|nr:site-specific integrase [Roseomonas nepalensis]
MGKLTAKAVQHAKPGVHGDGGGLYLRVKPDRRAFWFYRFMLVGKRRDMGIGAANGPAAVPLAAAREKAAAARRLVKAGSDPLVHRDAAEAAAATEVKAAQAQRKTFRDVTDLFLAAQEAGWRNAKHRAQWRSTLEAYAFPHFGDRPVADVNTGAVTAALKPIWEKKPETASRVRGRIEAVWNYAKVMGWCVGENPARWRGHLANAFPRRSKVKPVKHHAALRWQDIGAFMAALRAREAVSARALEFVILTAARSGEVLGARWSEVDMDAAVWTVPRERMKAGKEHRVPLTPAALAVLRGVLPLRTDAAADALIFPGQLAANRKEPKALSVMAMTMALRRMERGDLTVHGFRSTFRDWAGETTGHPREVVEAALAHRTGDKMEQAYARGDLFEKRRRLMAEWSAFCAKTPAKVARLPTRHEPEAAVG